MQTIPIDTLEHEARLDELILAASRRQDMELAVEHLRSARIFLLGGMPLEYAKSLEDSRLALGALEDPAVRRAFESALDQLAMEDPPATDVSHRVTAKAHGRIPRDATSRLWDFFSTSDISFGVFYPKKHVIAAFPTAEAATAAFSALRSAGFAEHEATVISPQEMLQFQAELKQHTGLWGKVMSEISRFFATEDTFVREDVARAKSGETFVAAYCATDEEFERIRQAFQPMQPLTIQRYLASGIQTV